MFCIALGQGQKYQHSHDTAEGRRGGGGHFQGKLYHIRENRPQKNTLNKDLRVDHKTRSTSDMDLFSHPK